MFKRKRNLIRNAAPKDKNKKPHPLLPVRNPSEELSSGSDVVILDSPPATCKSAHVKSISSRCPICLDEIKQGKTKLTCCHDFHAACLADHVAFKIKENALSCKILCPSCPQELSYREIVAHVKSRDELDLYHQSSLNMALLEQTDLRVCPTPDCSYVFWSSQEDERGRRAQGECGVVCPTCNLRCLSCFKGAHPGKPCKAARDTDADQRRIKDEKQFRRYMTSRKLKNCPHCRAVIEKVPTTCNKMTCRCGYRFCYKCMSKNANCHCTPAHHTFLPHFIILRGDSQPGISNVAPLFQALLHRLASHLPSWLTSRASSS